MLRPQPDLAQLAGEPADVLAAAQTAVDAPAGLGTIASSATEVALPATCIWSNPGKGGAQADLVLTAPEDGGPLLFVEIDNCYESAQELAAKIDKYLRFYLYDGKLPIVVTGVEQLKEHSPAGAIFRRLGRPHDQTLLEAIGNPVAKPTTPVGKPSTQPASGAPGAAAPRGRAAAGRARGPPFRVRRLRRPVHRRRLEGHRARRMGRPTGDPSAPVDDCKQRAITAEPQAQQPASEHQEPDPEVPEPRAGGTWLPRFRS
ncbi:hypothetical protein QBC31_42935 [Streptomyces sp. B21-079]|uniref:hypothetical protein n=1 Tax=Streptomyces sp. B21-079 TaxID=3039409 RepID=UPI002FEE76D6